MAEKKRRERMLTDPRAIKALAHPARLAVLERLDDGGELTATECAAVAGLSPSAMSYHLRALEKWGFVERAPAASDGRERPWRATSSQHGWRIAPGTPAANAATDALMGVSLSGLQAAMSAWTARERDETPDWQDVATMTTTSVWLTPAEAAEFGRAHRATLDGLRSRTDAHHPDGARRVRVALMVVPTD